MWAVRNILKGTLKFTDIRVDNQPVRLRSRAYFDLDKIDGGRAAALASKQVSRCFDDGYLQLIHKTNVAGEDAGLNLPANAEGHDSESLAGIKKQLEESGSTISDLMHKVLNESQRMRAVEPASNNDEELKEIKSNMEKIASSVANQQDTSHSDEIASLKDEMKEMMTKASTEKESQHQKELEEMKSNMQSMMSELLSQTMKQADVQKNVALEQAQIAHQEEIDLVKSKMDSKISEQSKQIEMLTSTIMNLAETTQANNAGVEDIKDMISQAGVAADNNSKRVKKLSKVDIDAAIVMAESLDNTVAGSNGPLGNQTKQEANTNDNADLLSEGDLDFD